MALNLKNIRRAAERLLLADECVIYKGADRLGEGTWDPNTLLYDPPDDEVMYQGPCNVQALNNFPSEIQMGGGPEVVLNYMVKIPANADLDIRKEDRVVITAVHARGGGDPVLVAEEFIVDASPEVGTYTVLRQIRVRRYESTPQ